MFTACVYCIAGCSQRPPEVLYGLVRFHTLRHGDRARYRCIPGFKRLAQVAGFKRQVQVQPRLQAPGIGATQASNWLAILTSPVYMAHGPAIYLHVRKVTLVSWSLQFPQFFQPKSVIIKLGLSVSSTDQSYLRHKW